STAVFEASSTPSSVSSSLDPQGKIAPMQLRADEISAIIKQQIQNFDRAALVSETGPVLATGDGIARVYGLEGVMAGELVEFPGGLFGLVLNLEQDNVGVAVLGEANGVKEGGGVQRTGRNRHAAT